MSAIPIKYVASVDLFFEDGKNETVDVERLVRECKDPEKASKELELIIHGKNENKIELIEYILDFDKIKSEVSFISSRFGNDDNWNSNLH